MTFLARPRTSTIVAVLTTGALVAGGLGLAVAHAGGLPVDLAVVWATGGAPRIEVVTVAARDVENEVAELAARGAQAAPNGPVRMVADSMTVAATDPRVSEQWAYERLGGQTLLDAGAVGSGVIVAVLDTGIDAGHPEFAGRVLAGYDFITDRPMPVAVDPGGHGTHVAGIIGASATNGEGIAGIAPGVTFLPVRVLDETGYGDDAGVARGLVWAVDNGAQVVNMSLGTHDDNPAMRAAVEYAASKGVLVVAAAGNDSAGGPISYPGAYADAYAVAATDARDQHAYFSTTGSYVDIAAPGQMILSTFPDRQYVTMSGTSMATPYVAGAVAAVMTARGVSPMQAQARLTATAVDIGASGRDQEFGDGLISITEATGVGDRVPPLANPPGLPGLPGLPPLPAVSLPPLTAPIRPQLPALPSLAPGRPSLTPGVLPTPSMPAAPSLAPLPSTPALPAPSAPSAPTLPTRPVTPPVSAPPTSRPPSASPTRPPAPVPSARPVPAPAPISVIALAARASSGGWTLTVQVAGPARAGAAVRILDANGSVRASGRAGATGQWTVTLRARAGDKVRAVSGSVTSNTVTLAR